MASRGIVGAGVYVPHWRLDRSTISAIAGGGGGKGTRSVAGYDEDTTTLGVEAARSALAPVGELLPRTIWFSTVAPAYADKTNATTIHAALRLDRAAGAFDVNGSVRSTMAALDAALHGRGTHLVVSADLRSGLAGGPDEATFGDAAAALVVGDGEDAPLLAECIGEARATEEFLDRWRRPGDHRSKIWEERFGETRYVPLGEQVWDDVLKAAGIVADQVDHVVIAGTHTRANAALAKRLAVGDRLRGELGDRLGNVGAAQPSLGLVAALEEASPGQVIVLLTLADGADGIVLRTTHALEQWTPARPLAAQVAEGASIDYGTYLRWRGLLPAEPPRRPEPARPSATAATRSSDWKFGFVGSADDGGGVHLPPLPGDPTAAPMADVRGTVVTFTIDRLAYSPSPPIVFAVIDFDGGGRLPLELTDIDISQVQPGARVELTFRKLFTADDIHNYFWKARVI